MNERIICFDCHRPQSVCLCAYVKPIKTQFKFIFLMHPKEYKKEKNGTARLAHLCLENSEIIDGVDFTHNHKVNNYIATSKCYVLYPGEDAFNLNQPTAELINLFQSEKEIIVFIIDGTWPCAKKMMRLSKNLQNLPRLMFLSDKKSDFLIKQQPHELCLSTIESVHEFLNLTEDLTQLKIENKDVLLTIFKQLNQIQIECANDPNRQGYRRKAYKLEGERIVKRQKGRRLFFE